jgi:beta-glucosidase
MQFPEVANSRTTTPIEALRAAVGDRIDIRTASTPSDAIKVAASSDVVIYLGGLNTSMERASIDRYSLDLTADQQTDLAAVVKANPLTILVLQGGSAIGLEWAKTHVPAIVMFWYGGEQGGPALADTLLGISNPAGRLPVTFYRSTEDLPSMDDFELAPSQGKPGRTYMYLDRPATYPFGHGLSYTTFSYSNLRLESSTTSTPDSALTATVDIANIGRVDGDEVVQLYARKPDSTVTRPLKQLVAFQRIHLAKGASTTVHLNVTRRALSYWNTQQHAFLIEPGAYELQAAPSSADPAPAAATITLK